MGSPHARLSRLVTGLLGALALTGCASIEPTPYGPAVADGAPGFADQQIEENRYEIRFVGNGSTAAATVERYLLFRAAEVTLAAGAEWFRFVEREVRPEPSALRGGPVETLESTARGRAARKGGGKRARGGGKRARGNKGWRAQGPKGRGRHGGYRHGYKRGYGHGYGRGYRRRYGGGVRFGFYFGGPYWGYGPYFGPYWGPYGWGFGGPYYYGVPYTVRPRPPAYEAVAEILVFSGPVPEEDDRAYAAAEVVEQLRPAIRFAEHPAVE